MNFYFNSDLFRDYVLYGLYFQYLLIKALCKYAGENRL